MVQIKPGKQMNMMSVGPQEENQLAVFGQNLDQEIQGAQTHPHTNWVQISYEPC